MDIKLQPNITGTNVNLVKGATQADLTNAVNNAKTYRDEAQAFSIVSKDKSIESAYSALNASVSATTAIDKANIATNKATEANNSAINASASESVCIAKATIATDNADIATAQAVIATNKATEANTSANTANTQANIAIAKASEASISASNALTSENNADTSEANALIYRNQAESFANSINPSDLVHISGTETITGNKTFSGTVSGLTKATVGLSNVDNTSDANKPISTATQTALNTKVDKVVSTDNAVVRFDGTTGDLQNSAITIDDNGNIGSGTQSFNGLGGSGFKNYIINGNFNIWQRGNSINSGFAYRADRWFAYRGGANIGLTVSKQTGILANTYSARVQRNSGITDLWVNIIKQTFETTESMKLVGKTITLSFYARKGADYSSSSNLLYSGIQEHTSIDGPMIDIGITNNQSNTLTTTWQKFTHTYTIQASTTQIAINFWNTPTGTAGTNDYFEITNVQLEEGSIATPFEQRPYGLEFSLCQRYFEKSYADDIVIGTLTNENAYSTSNLSQYLLHAPIVNFKVPKRVRPTIVFYNPYASNTGNAIEYNTGSVAVSDRPIYALNIGKNCMKVQSSNGSLVAGNFILFHYTASAEL